MVISTIYLYPIIENSENIKGLNKEFEDIIINSGSVADARKILESGINVNATDKYNRTLLYIASYFHEVELVQLLIEFGANIDTKDIKGITPLNIGCHGDNRIVTVTDESKTEKVVYHSKFDRIKTVKVLLDNNADINSRAKNGVTPLIRASSNGHFEIVETLFEYGADPDIQANDGSTALSQATKYNFKDIVELLKRK